MASRIDEFCIGKQYYFYNITTVCSKTNAALILSKVIIRQNEINY